MRLKKKKPYLSIIVLCLLLIFCLFAEMIMNHNPNYMDLEHISLPPCREFFFGTDFMGRDVFSMIWYGGRISLFIGFLATVISTAIGVLYGCISGFSSKKADDLMMRLIEIILSIPSILVIIFVSAMIGRSNPVAIAAVIGITSWMNIAKAVQSEVRQLRDKEYIVQAFCMGGNFFYVLRRHILPELVPSLMFMVVSSIGSAISIESTLSFLGIGLPPEIISWGSLLSEAERAMLSNRWWLILIPGIFLAVLLLSITEIGNYIRKDNNKRCSNL